jgi:hypothetical protein
MGDKQPPRCAREPRARLARCQCDDGIEKSAQLFLGGHPIAYAVQEFAKQFAKPDLRQPK